MRQILGKRGEAIFTSVLTEFHANRGPLFDPTFLGDRWPAVDFFVELEGTPFPRPFFFVQVRTTSLGYTKKRRRLRAKIPTSAMARLRRYPVPTYVVGIDEGEPRGYLISANQDHPAVLSSLSTAFPINPEIRELLWQEVMEYWAKLPTAPQSRFEDPDWS